MWNNDDFDAYAYGDDKNNDYDADSDDNEDNNDIGVYLPVPTRVFDIK